MERSVCCGQQAPNSFTFCGGFVAPAPKNTKAIKHGVYFGLCQKRLGLHLQIIVKHQVVHNKNIQVCAALLAADCLVYTLVDPRTANAVWLFIGFVLLAMTLYSIGALVARSVQSYGSGVYMPTKRFARYAAVTIIVLIGLQSIGQLTVRDMVTLLPFAAILYMYIGYGRKQAAENT